MEWLYNHLPLTSPAIMTYSEKFCLKWNDCQTNTGTYFRELSVGHEFSDVTLATADKKTVQAHKLVLAASSPLFRNLLQENNHPHPLIYLKGIQSSTLHSVIAFIYHGEVNIEQEDLDICLDVAQELLFKCYFY